MGKSSNRQNPCTEEIKNILTQQNDYRALTKEQVAIFMHFCFCNAKDLCDDAEILRKSGKFARAIGLSILALEELAKIPLIFNALVIPKGDSSTWKEFWLGLRSHDLKQSVWKVYGNLFLQNIKGRYRYRIPANTSLEDLKWRAFYVDCVMGYALRPAKLFSSEKPILASINRILEERVRNFGEMHSTFANSIKVVDQATNAEIDPEFIVNVKEAVRKRRKETKV